MSSAILRFLSVFSLTLGLLACPASPPAGIPAPVSELLSVGAPDSSGRVLITGDPGAVNPGAEVTATNTTETSSFYPLFQDLFLSEARAGEGAIFVNSITAGPDGSFSLFLDADFGDVIEIIQTVGGASSDPTGVVVSGETIFLGVPLQDLAVSPLGGTVHVSGNDGETGLIFDLNFGNFPLLSLPSPLCNSFGNGITRIALDGITHHGFVIAPDLNAIFTFSLEGPCQPLSFNVPHRPLDVTAEPASGGVLVGVEAAGGLPSVLSYGADGPNPLCNIEIIHPGEQNHVASFLLATGPSRIVYAISEFADGSVWATRLMTASDCMTPQPANIELPAGTQASGLAALDGTRAMISDANSNQVLIADFTSNVIVGQVPVGEGPRGIAVDSGNHYRAFVVNMGDNTLSVIDLNDFSVQTIASVGLMPSEIGLLPGGNQAVILSTSDQSVVLLGLNF